MVRPIEVNDFTDREIDSLEFFRPVMNPLDYSNGANEENKIS